MGYRPKRKTYLLEFEDPDLNGLEVKVRGLSTGQVLDLTTAKEDGSDESIRSLLMLLAGQLIEWNVEDDAGRPVPADLDGVRSQEIAFNMAIINAWEQALVGVPAPLESGSPSGEPSPVELALPMEPLSPSPESFAVPA